MIVIAYVLKWEELGKKQWWPILQYTATIFNGVTENHENFKLEQLLSDRLLTENLPGTDGLVRAWVACSDRVRIRSAIVIFYYSRLKIGHVGTQPELWTSYSQTATHETMGFRNGSPEGFRD